MARMRLASPCSSRNSWPEGTTRLDSLAAHAVGPTSHPRRRVTVLAAVAIKPFGVAKERLSTVLDSNTRALVGMAVAEHTLAAVAAAGAKPAVVTGHDEVARWAARLGFATVRETAPGLDSAADSVIAAADGRPWAIIHADLPLVTAMEIDLIVEALARNHSVLAPSADGGTTVVASELDHFEFRYGPGSFRRHLRSATLAGTVAVVIRKGLALDLDTPQDLATALTLPTGAWLADLLQST